MADTTTPAKKAAAKKAPSAATEVTQGTEWTAPTMVGAKPPTVYEAWSDVMNDAQGLGKHQHNAEGGNYNFRGIDDVMNLLGPILRRHRVSVIPTVQSASYRDVRTSRDKPAREVTVQVQFTIIGPAGDTIIGSAPGESMDNGDKGTPKAMSVALRTFLLQSLMLPTNERDPDSQTYERAGGKTPEQMAQSVVDQMPEQPTVPQLQGVKKWASDRVLLDITVRNGDSSLPLLSYLDELIDAAAARDPEAQAAKQAAVDKAMNGGSDA